MNICPRFLAALLLLFLFIFFPIAYFSPFPIYAQYSSTLDTVRDIVNTTTAGATATHSVSFQLPKNAQAIIATDYIQINLQYYSGVTAPTIVAGTYSGSPTFSVSSTTARVTGIHVLPGNSITIEGLTGVTPLFPDQRTVVVSVTEDAAGLLVKNTGSTVATMNDFVVDVTAIVDTPLGRLKIEGYSAPYTYILFTEGEAVIGTDIAGPTGYFGKLFPSLQPTTHYISVYGIDTQNRTTSVNAIEIYTPAYQTITISDEILSPTLEIDSTEIQLGDLLHASGSAYPGSTITIFTDTPVQTYVASASATGNWFYTIDATSSAYNPGDYRIFTLAQAIGGLQSILSPAILFSITSGTGGSGTPCGNIDQGDLNCDDIIDLTDFSILMYYWGT